VTTGVGLHRDMPAVVYNDDPCDEPSLSSSIGALLLSATPRHAACEHPRLNPSFVPKPTTAEMDLGSVTHRILLGKGQGFEVSPFENYKTKTAREWRDYVISKGIIPISGVDLDRAIAMAKAVSSVLSTVQGAESAFTRGEAETVAIWRDRLGPLCRARFDWLDLENGVVYDLKTTGRGLGDRAINARIAGDAAYDMRGAFYLRGLEQSLEDYDIEKLCFRWVFVESAEPFEARVFEMDSLTRANGDRKAVRAIEIWRECLARDNWPGYPRKIERPECPEWALEDIRLPGDEI
jgi:PDDEXK-like domain of unknown function (DUF3799)